MTAKHTWIALLRGINVGGKNIVPMKDLRAMLGDIGYSDVTTYIQSGNCVLSADTSDRKQLQARIVDAFQRKFGFRPAVFVLSLEELVAAIDNNPFARTMNEAKNLHLSFGCEPVTDAALAGLQECATDDEEFRFIDGVLYVYTPHGIGRSKAASKIGRFLPGEMTARNLRTVRKLADLAASHD